MDIRDWRRPPLVAEPSDALVRRAVEEGLEVSRELFFSRLVDYCEVQTFAAVDHISRSTASV